MLTILIASILLQTLQPIVKDFVSILPGLVYVMAAMKKIYLSKTVERVLKEADFSRLGDNVGIKLHFGEAGCITYIKPEIVKAVCDEVVRLEKKATLIECNVLYRGSRTNATDHVRTAKEHGFDFSPVDILDDEYGQEFIEVSLEKGLTKKAKLGKGLKKYDSLIVLTHFTGHEAAGYGGAIKNVGMGLGSRAGKLTMHSDIRPSIDRRKCVACGTCAENCDVDAIEIDKKAKINHEKCIGCAMCIAVCPEKAVKVPWHGSTSEQLQKKIVGHVEGVMRVIPREKMIFINVLQNVTSDCDCMSTKQRPMMKDIGILLADDIVAVDKASLDLANKHSRGKFGDVHGVDSSTQIDYACEKGLGSRDYGIIELA